MSAGSRQLQISFFFAFLLAVLVLTFRIFQPYLITLMTAATFAVIMRPVFNWFRVRVRDHAAIAALLTVVVTILIVLLPITLIATKVIREAGELYARLAGQANSNGMNLIQWMEEWVRQYFPDVTIDLESYLRQALLWVGRNIGAVFTGTLHTLIQLFLGLIAFFYLLKDGDRFVSYVVMLSPLSDSYDNRIMARLEKAINSILKGSLLIALLQGISSGVGMAIFGVPTPTLWGTAAAFAALIPGVGTATVLVPAILFLFLTDNTVAGIGLALWGALGVGMIDNFLGPVLVGRGVRIHPLLVLIAVIGGVQMFGPLGFILGPLVLSLLYALLDIYRLFFIQKNRFAASA